MMWVVHESPAFDPASGRSGVDAGDGVDAVGAAVVDEWLLAADASVLTGDQLSARMLHHERGRAALDARMAEDAGVWDGLQIWAGDGATSGAAWLAPRAGMTVAAARKRMKVVRWLRQAPLVLAALGEARVTWPKVEAFAQQVTDACMDRFAVDEEMLVGLASTLSVEDTTRMLRHWASKADPDLDEDDEDRRFEQRTAYLSETWLGMGDLAGNLSGVSDGLCRSSSSSEVVT
jgi:hypothetical protein